MTGPPLYRKDYWFVGELVSLYRYHGPFEVDGIVYRYRNDNPYGGYSSRPMIELLPDYLPLDYDFDGPAYMFCSDPPTEEELDLYVNDRILPAT